MKTTKAQFEQFKESFLKYQSIFGLQSYGIFFEHKKCEEEFATIEVRPDIARALVQFNTEIEPYDMPEFDPVESGKHEVIHLLLAKIRYLADKRYLSAREIDEEDERLAVLLTKVIP